jgi:hypothetical protein
MAGPEIGIEQVFDQDQRMRPFDQIKYAAFMSVIASYDKKITREKFAEILMAAFNLYGTTIRHGALLGTKQFVLAGGWDEGRIDRYLKAHETAGGQEYGDLYKQMLLVCACPCDHDVIQ